MQTICVEYRYPVTEEMAKAVSEYLPELMERCLACRQSLNDRETFVVDAKRATRFLHRTEFSLCITVRAKEYHSRALRLKESVDDIARNLNAFLGLMVSWPTTARAHVTVELVKYESAEF